MKKVILSVLAVLPFSVFASDDGVLTSGQGTETIYAKYSCYNKMTYDINVAFNNKENNIEVTYNESKVTIPQALSADGARYANDNSEYWFKGDRLTINGKVKCKEIAN